ncbi:MAG: phosphodiester glycosidase family protein, partial [Clostridia bacterium]|nr:phosphodiester glycosidase family protein [Clostridia bacterium]
SDVYKRQPYVYTSSAEKTQDFSLSLHTLEIDPSNPNVVLRPVLSHESLFGYALLSDMDKKWGALATINGGFSHPTGLLGGLCYLDGELLTSGTGQYPVLFGGDGKVALRDIKNPIWLEGSLPDKAGRNTAKAPDEPIKLKSLYYNEYPDSPGLYVLTPTYGSENRVDGRQLNAVVSNGVVQRLIESNASFEIPKDGFLVTAVGAYAENRLREGVKPGMQLKIRYDITPAEGALPPYAWAYECGSWIVKNKTVVVPNKDNWVGTLETRTPRTAVGIKADGKVVFVVVDGRQKGLSDGLTGRELAERLLAMGVTDAAFLDGGASSEMIINGKMMNSPAAGRERLLASGFVLIKNDFNP